MGNNFLDQYSLLHYAAGVVAYFWNVGPWSWLFAHASFEFAENTDPGMKFINNYLTWWPGGKPHADSLLNIVGDNLSAMAGWWCAYHLNDVGKRRGWYGR